jgi:Flp pilus assembly protein TadB
MAMPLKILISLLLLAALAAGPWLWQLNPLWVALVVPLAGAWAIWLVVEYLRWARRLGQSRPLAPSASPPQKPNQPKGD